MFPSLLPATVEPVWCPALGVEEEEALSQEETAFEQSLEAIRRQPAPAPIGVYKNLGLEEEEENHEDDQDDDDDDELDDDELEEASLDDEDDDMDEEMGSDTW